MLKITKDKTFKEVLSRNPKLINVFLKHGLHCASCVLAGMESIEEGAKAHGLSEKEIKKLIDELNKKG